MGKFIKHAIGRLPLLVALLVTSGLATAQTQGLDLSVNREIIDTGDGRLTCQLSCEASVDTVTLESLAIMWLNLDIKASNVHTVTKGGKNLGSFSLDGLTGNGTGDIGNTNGFIILEGLDEDTCTSDQFLCEAAFTGASGVKERAFAASLPQRPQSSRLEKTVEEMSSALEKLNMSYTQLLMDSNKDGEENAKLKARLEALEKKVSSLLSGPQSCDPCSNVSRAVEELEERLEQLENQNRTENNNTPDDVSPESICEKRRFDGSVGFQRTWADYKSGFGNVSTEFWLGNEALYNLTNSESYEMRVDLRLHNEPAPLYNTYTNIVVESESDK